MGYFDTAKNLSTTMEGVGYFTKSLTDLYGAKVAYDTLKETKSMNAFNRSRLASQDNLQAANSKALGDAAALALSYTKKKKSPVTGVPATGTVTG